MYQASRVDIALGADSVLSAQDQAAHAGAIFGESLSEPHQTSGWPSSLAAILDRRRRRTFNF